MLHAPAVPTPEPDSSVALSLAALVISILAAGFSGWQALLNASRRKHEKSVILFLTHQRAQFNEIDWKLQNTGGSACKVKQVNVTAYVKRRPKHFWSGTVKDVIGSNDERFVTWDRPLPTFDVKNSGNGEPAWDSFKVTALVARSGSKRFKEVKVQPSRK